MTPAGLRKSIRNRTLTYDRVHTLAKHLGVYVNVVADIVTDPKLHTLADLPIEYARIPRQPVNLTFGQFLDWLHSEQDALRAMLVTYMQSQQKNPSNGNADGNSED